MNILKQYGGWDTGLRYKNILKNLKNVDFIGFLRFTFC